MTNSHFSRRHFLKSAGLAGVSLLGASTGAQAQQTSSPPDRFRCNEFGAQIRKNFRTLTASELNTYKNGVAVMKSRPITDPTSWAYQAAMHATNIVPVKPAWNTCQHNTMHFLSWHRMYLCFFERILRKASGDPNFTLPYWNYSDPADPNARQLPAAFRIPATAANPLYTSNRNSSINSGTGLLSSSAVSLTSVIPGPIPFNTFNNNLESTPHGAVHMGIGGGMTTFAGAGLDPIFWLHHCNVDRLWNKWLAQGGGRQNPIVDATWLYTKFTFFDENALQVKMTGSELLSFNCNPCKYCYDEESVYEPDFVIFNPRNWSTAVLGTVTGLPVFGPNTISFQIRLNNQIRDGFARLLDAQTDQSAFLKLEFADARASEAMEFYYEVYVNLPASVKEPYFTENTYAGNLSFFGADIEQGGHHKLRFSVDITEAIKKLPPKELGEQTLTITLVPSALETEQGNRIAIRSKANVEVGMVTLILEEVQSGELQKITMPQH